MEKEPRGAGTMRCQGGTSHERTKPPAMRWSRMESVLNTTRLPLSA